MNDSVVQKGHPKGLYVLFATEMWERFNYYGMRAILILFMTKALLFDKAFASNLYGSYTGLVYLTPLLGGYIADRYWGNHRSIITGGLVMALGEFVLFFCSSVYHSAPQLSSILFFTGLGLMIAGNGFFKPNISSLVGQLYPDKDNRKDAAYTIFYMGINVGGALGPFVCGLVGDTGNPVDFKWSFLVGGIGMLLSVLVQMAFHHKYVKGPTGKVLGLEPESAPKNATNPIVVFGGLLLLSLITVALIYIDAKVFNYLFYLLIACILLIAFIVFTDKGLSSAEKSKVSVIFIVSFFVIFFWSAFEQAGASLTFFADEQTDRHLGLTIPIILVQIVSIAILLGCFYLYRSIQKSLSNDFDKRLRITANSLIAILGIAILVSNISILQSGKKVIDLNQIPASFFQSLNSVFVVSFAPIFAWLWLKLGKKEPSSPTKMALGLLLLAIGYLWIAFGVNNVAPGIKVSMIWLTGMYALHTCGELCLSPIGMSLVNQLAPLKFASMLMAVWFTANAFANKFAGVLSSLYPDKTPTSFLGIYQMNNLYDFFMLFVVMAGVASLILFLLTKKLQTMMKA
ncbi:peptide MFS transporter [Parasediminibacterium paludis]|uniref:Peptide MFS transporter n=1 Tax=Parasediminibacterium paludis TaxID=908966 RepID=A0ABV8PX95_9BACT